MPKLKTNKGAAKRFKKTGSGKFKYRSCNRSHGFSNKSTKRKRHLRAGGIVDKTDQLSIERLLQGS
ncbi:MAG: 50S ribosomal protein L35 [Gammaproteobacteria bacterium]